MKKLYALFLLIPMLTLTACGNKLTAEKAEPFVQSTAKAIAASDATQNQLEKELKKDKETKAPVKQEVLDRYKESIVRAKENQESLFNVIEHGETPYGMEAAKESVLDVVAGRIDTSNQLLDALDLKDYSVVERTIAAQKEKDAQLVAKAVVDVNTVFTSVNASESKSLSAGK